jgi:hypothetical protein
VYFNNDHLRFNQYVLQPRISKPLTNDRQKCTRRVKSSHYRNKALEDLGLAVYGLIKATGIVSCDSESAALTVRFINSNTVPYCVGGAVIIGIYPTVDRETVSGEVMAQSNADQAYMFCWL